MAPTEREIQLVFDVMSILEQRIEDMEKVVKDEGREPGQRSSKPSAMHSSTFSHSKVVAPAASKFAELELQVETTISNWEKYPQTKYPHFITEFPQNAKKYNDINRYRAARNQF